MKKPTLYERARASSWRLWKWNWTTMPSTPVEVQGIIARAWQQGYRTAQRDEKKKGANRG